MGEKDLVEKKATGDDSMAADSTTAAGGAVKMRRADKKLKVATGSTDNIEDDVKTPQGKHDVGMKEELEEFNLEEAFGGLFEGTDLSEDFKNKTVAIFESAVNQRVSTFKQSLEEHFDIELTEQLDIVVEELVGKLDSYLDTVVEDWMADNEVSVESNIKVEVAESLLSGIKGLVTEHNINLDEEGIDVLASTEEKLEESNTKYNALFDEMVALKEDNLSLELESAFRDVAEGLTDTQSDKLTVLAEGLTFKNVNDYTAKVEAIRENYFAESTTTAADSTELLEEATDEVAAAPVLEPSIAGYASALDRYATTR